MLKKINKIHNLGLFRNYQWSRSLNEFARYNLLYAPNGSGKTTLSRLFSALEDGMGHELYPDLKYEVVHNDTSYTQTQPIPANVRVFNQEYVERNLQLIDGKAESIYIIGEESAVLLESIRSDEANLQHAQQQIQKLEQEIRSIDKDIDSTFTRVARTISDIARGHVPRKYHRNNAQADYERIEHAHLDEEQRDEAIQYLRQEQYNRLESIRLPSIDLTGRMTPILESIENLMSDAHQVCKKTVPSLVIERLSNNSDISTWVEEGIALHNTHRSDRCEYCTQSIPQVRLNELAAHFSDSDQMLKSEIDRLLLHVEKIKHALSEVVAPEDIYLYKQLQHTYKAVASDMYQKKQQILDALQSLSDKLKDKKAKQNSSC